MNEREIIDEVVKELYERLMKQPSYVFLIGPEEVPFVTELKKQSTVIVNRNEITTYDCIVVTNLTIAMLSHLALGTCVTSNEEEILKALLEDKPVYVVEEGIKYRQYKQTSRKALYNLYKEYEEKLKVFGIRIIQSAKEIGIRKELPVTEEVQVQEQSLELLNKKLLLEKDFMEYHLGEQATVTVAKNCIITPMAQDYIRSHQIKIIKR